MVAAALVPHGRIPMGRAERLFELFYYLDHKQGRTLDDMASRFKISERTVFRDLASLQASGVNLEVVEGRYRRLGSAPRRISLESGELRLVRLALDDATIDKRRGPIARALRSLRDRLDQALRERRREQAKQRPGR